MHFAVPDNSGTAWGLYSKKLFALSFWLPRNQASIVQTRKWNMASGGEHEDITSSEDINRRLEYENANTSSRTRELLPEAELMTLASLKLKPETSSATRDELAKVEAEIAREEEDSSTMVPLSPSKLPSSGRDKVNASTERLNFIRSRKAQVGQLFETLKRSQTVDLCFLIDCTDSMQSYIDEVKNKIKDLVFDCKEKFADLVLKVAFVGYRDHCDGEDKRIVFLPFTTEISAFKAFVSRIKAGGGGDDAEDVFGGLEQVGDLKWSAPTRIVFHVADAPCHGSKFHDGVGDSYPNGDPRGRRAEDLLNKLEQLQVKYWFAKLNNTTDKMVAMFRSLLKDPDMLQLVTLDSAEELISAVARTVSCSIREMESVTLADAAIEAYFVENQKTAIECQNPREIKRTKSRSQKDFTLCKDEPNWNKIDGEDAYVFKNKLPTSMEELQASLKEEGRKSRKIQIAAQPFAEGTQRIVYYGVDCTFSPSKKVVLKEFKYLGEGLNKLDSYKEQMEIQSISSFLAQQFNKEKPQEAKDIFFTKVVTISLYKRSKPFYCSQEPLIEGPYVKYNSNYGFVNKDSYAASLNAFTHWTYQVTDGYLMVVDLQGVKITNPAGPKFALTDPALHCKDLTRFSSTNLGKRGMHRFFRTHYCNTICKAMELEPHLRLQPADSSTGHELKGTIVTP